MILKGIFKHAEKNGISKGILNAILDDFGLSTTDDPDTEVENDVYKYVIEEINLQCEE